jgi:hypothetical protein
MHCTWWTGQGMGWPGHAAGWLAGETGGLVGWFWRKGRRVRSGRTAPGAQKSVRRRGTLHACMLGWSQHKDGDPCVGEWQGGAGAGRWALLLLCPLRPPSAAAPQVVWLDAAAARARYGRWIGGVLPELAPFPKTGKARGGSKAAARAAAGKQDDKEEEGEEQYDGTERDEAERHYVYLKRLRWAHTTAAAAAPAARLPRWQPGSNTAGWRRGPPSPAPPPSPPLGTVNCQALHCSQHAFTGMFVFSAALQLCWLACMALACCKSSSVALPFSHLIAGTHCCWASTSWPRRPWSASSGAAPPSAAACPTAATRRRARPTWRRRLRRCPQARSPLM